MESFRRGAMRTQKEVRMRLRIIVQLVTVACLVSQGAVLAQQPQGEPSPASAQASSGARLPNYILGPNDEIVILAVDAEEIANKPIRITTSGDINLPMVG